MNMIKKIFTLNDLITPKIINIIYVATIIFAVSYGLLIIAFALVEDIGITGIVLGIMIMIFSPIFVRVWFEIIKVPFRILEELQKINNEK